MKKNTLYLHIGTGKTGTTALQEFFFSNKKLLQKKGIIYPEIGLYTTAHHLIGDSLKGVQNTPVPPKEIHEYLSAICCLQGNVLISAENVWFAKKEVIEPLRKLMDVFDVKVVVYLRRQDSFIMSRYNLFAQVSLDAGSVYDHLRRTEKIVNYYAVLGKWSEIFGKENVIVRPYEKSQFYNGTIFADFMHHVLNMDLTDKYLLPTSDSNPRLSRDAAEYKFFINRLPLERFEKTRFNLTLLNYSAQQDPETTRAFRGYVIYSPEERLEIIKKYEPSNARIAQEYLGREDGRLFLDPLPDIHETYHPYAGLSKEKTKECTDYIYAQSSELMSLLCKGIALGLKSRNKREKRAAKTLHESMPTEYAEMNSTITIKTIRFSVLYKIHGFLKYIIRRFRWNA